MSRLDTYLVNNLMYKWCQELKIDHHRVLYKIIDGNLHIYTTRPGLWIGKAGATIARFQAQLNAEVSRGVSPDAQAIQCQILLTEVNSIMSPEELDDYCMGRCMMWGIRRVNDENSDVSSVNITMIE